MQLLDDSPEILQRISRVKTLRTLPLAAQQLCEIVKDDDISIEEMSRLISSDQILAARVLRLVNSSFYGFPQRISTITQAIVLLGYNVIKGLVISAAMIDYMTTSMIGLYEHSLGCSVASLLIARKIKETDPEEAQVAGLLHDIGKIIVAIEFEHDFEQIQQLVEEENLSFFEAEKKVLNQITHCEIADYLCAQWHLPLRLREAIVRHHRPHRAKSAPRLATIVQLGDALVRATGFGSGGDPWVPDINEDWFEDLELSDSMLLEVINELHYELAHIDVASLLK